MNDPIRSVGMVRQGVERARGADAAAQQRFLAMLAAVRQIETGPEAPMHPHSTRIVREMGADPKEMHGGRDIHQIGVGSRAVDLDPSLILGRDPVLRVRDAMDPTAAPRAALSVSATATVPDGAASRSVSQSARPRAAAEQMLSQTGQDAGRARSAGSPREGVPGRADASAHRTAMPAQPGAHSPTPFAAAAPISASPAAGHTVQQMGVASSAQVMATPGGPARAANGSSLATSGSDAQNAAQKAGIVIARSEVATAALRSGADARAYLDAPSDAARAQAEAPSVALHPDLRQIRHGRATGRSLPDASGRAAEPADSELGAMLRHLMGAGGAQRAQRLADGSWATRIAIPGEGAVSIRIARSPEQISVRLSGDPELVRRVRETLEAGGARDGRRLSIQDSAEA